jgi:hypothetical protein
MKDTKNEKAKSTALGACSAKPTPGPWYEASMGNHQGLVVDEQTGANVAVVYDKANARLIASAPELLEALAVLVDHAQETYPHFEDIRGQADISKALSAISKAKGE